MDHENLTIGYDGMDLPFSPEAEQSVLARFCWIPPVWTGSRKFFRVPIIFIRSITC